MKHQDLKLRTKNYALSILKFLNDLPNGYPYLAINSQLTRSSMSVGANYRAAYRAKSTPDFINKLKIVEEECDETLYFLELLIEIIPEKSQAICKLTTEGKEILAMTVASIKTARNRLKLQS